MNSSAIKQKCKLFKCYITVNSKSIGDVQVSTELSCFNQPNSEHHLKQVYYFTAVGGIGSNAHIYNYPYPSITKP